MRNKGIRACVLAAWSFGLALAGAGTTATARATGRAGAPPVSFNRDIRPILANNCFACHGPDEKHRETKFHFDTEDGAYPQRRGLVAGHSGAPRARAPPPRAAAVSPSRPTRPTAGSYSASPIPIRTSTCRHRIQGTR